MATIEQVKAAVLEVFEKQQHMRAISAWPISARTWQVEAEDGNVYTLTW